MSKQRFRVFVLFFVFVLLSASGGLYYTIYCQPSRPDFVFDSRKKISPRTVRTQKESGVLFLIDTEKRIRLASWKQQVVNPLLLSEDELLEESGLAQPNPWPAFQKLYLRYYADFYRNRLDKTISSFDSEVRLAYSYWKRNKKNREVRD
ncbi:MAG: hypothetical protein ACLFN5_07135 [bacterium]